MTKAPTPAQIAQNRERTTKAVERMNAKVQAMGVIRYRAIVERNDSPAVVAVDYRPYKSNRREYADDQWGEVLRVTTSVDDTIGYPIDYTNEYKSSTFGTICRRVHDAETRRRNRIDGLRTLERKVRVARDELLAAEAAVASRREELGMDPLPSLLVPVPDPQLEHGR